MHPNVPNLGELLPIPTPLPNDIYKGMLLALGIRNTELADWFKAANLPVGRARMVGWRVASSNKAFRKMSLKELKMMTDLFVAARMGRPLEEVGARYPVEEVEETAHPSRKALAARLPGPMPLPNDIYKGMLIFLGIRNDDLAASVKVAKLPIGRTRLVGWRLSSQNTKCFRKMSMKELQMMTDVLLAMRMGTPLEEVGAKYQLPAASAAA